MKQSDIPELHYITAIHNVPSIMRLGILCRSHMTDGAIDHIDIAKEAVRQRRGKLTPSGAELYEYVNLFINARNAMLYALLREGWEDSICVLRVSTSVLDIPHVVIGAGSVAGSGVRFYDFGRVAEGLETLNADEVLGDNWAHERHDGYREHLKSIMLSEVLVPDCVPAKYIQGAYVSSSPQAIAALKNNPTIGIGVEINPRFFFR